MNNRKLRMVLIVTILICVFSGGVYFFKHNKSYKNQAIERGDVIYLNGVPYCTTSELDKYTVTNSNFALEKVPIHLENSIITGIKIA